MQGLMTGQVMTNFTIQNRAWNLGFIHCHYLCQQWRVSSLTTAAVSAFSANTQLSWGGLTPGGQVSVS